MLGAKYSVETYSYKSMGEFVEAWNSLDGEYEYIYILAHGYPGGLSCKGESIEGSGNEEYSFWDLKPVSAANVCLYSCNGATLPSEGMSAAHYFAILTGGSVKAVADGKLNFVYGTGIPWPVKGGYWTIVTPLYTIN